jgi:hypothetical protein
MRKYLAAIPLAAALVACAAQPTPETYRETQPMTAAVAKLRAEAKPPPPPVDVCDATISNPYLIKECANKTGRPLDQATAKRIEIGRQNAGMLDDSAIRAFETERRIAATQDAVTRATAECNYVAKQAAAGPRYTGFGTGWLGPAFTNSFAGLMDGIVAGKNCQDYYRDIGVIR